MKNLKQYEKIQNEAIKKDNDFFNLNRNEQLTLLFNVIISDEKIKLEFFKSRFLISFIQSSTFIVANKTNKEELIEFFINCFEFLNNQEELTIIKDNILNDFIILKNEIKSVYDNKYNTQLKTKRGTL